jgi:2'-5' RNA ligase
MGNVGPEDVPDIKDAVSEVCNGFGPFMLRLKGMGVFPDLRRSRVLWVGLDGEIERMSLLKDSLQEHLSRFGIKKEDRRFRPHLTLGRFRKPERDRSLLTGILSEYRDFGSPACRMDELVLFKSDLRSGGAVYTKLGSWRLHGEK